MKCIRFFSLLKLQDGSGYVRSTVFHYLKLSRTRSTHTMLMFFDVMIWDIIWWSDSWFGLVSCLYVQIEMITRFGFLRVHCGRYGIWTLDIVCTHIPSLVSCEIPIVYSFSIIYIVLCIVFWVFWSPINMLYESRKHQDLVRVWLGIWINKMIVWVFLVSLTSH